MAEIINLEAHAARHAYGGADAIGNNALRFAQIGKEIGTETSITIAAGDTAVIPAGVYLVSENTAVNIEYTPDGGVTWRVVVSGHGGLIISDGANVRAVNTDTVNPQTIYLLPWI